MSPSPITTASTAFTMQLLGIMYEGPLSEVPLYPLSLSLSLPPSLHSEVTSEPSVTSSPDCRPCVVWTIKKTTGSLPSISLL